MYFTNLVSHRLNICLRKFFYYVLTFTIFISLTDKNTLNDLVPSDFSIRYRYVVFSICTRVMYILQETFLSQLPFSDSKYPYVHPLLTFVGQTKYDQLRVLGESNLVTLFPRSSTAFFWKHQRVASAPISVPRYKKCPAALVRRIDGHLKYEREWGKFNSLTS